MFFNQEEVHDIAGLSVESDNPDLVVKVGSISQFEILAVVALLLECVDSIVRQPLPPVLNIKWDHDVGVSEILTV